MWVDDAARLTGRRLTGNDRPISTEERTNYFLGVRKGGRTLPGNKCEKVFARGARMEPRSERKGLGVNGERIISIGRSQHVLRGSQHLSYSLRTNHYMRASCDYFVW